VHLMKQLKKNLQKFWKLIKYPLSVVVHEEVKEEKWSTAVQMAGVISLPNQMLQRNNMRDASSHFSE
jgi:hypothetical protein